MMVSIYFRLLNSGFNVSAIGCGRKIDRADHAETVCIAMIRVDLAAEQLVL